MATITSHTHRPQAGPRGSGSLGHSSSLAPADGSPSLGGLVTVSATGLDRRVSVTSGSGLLHPKALRPPGCEEAQPQGAGRRVGAQRPRAEPSLPQFLPQTIHQQSQLVPAYTTGSVVLPLCLLPSCDSAARSPLTRGGTWGDCAEVLGAAPLLQVPNWL